ncbi:MAG: hypothetical protein R2814_01015 [Flavobacteriaceae bacterium]
MYNTLSQRDTGSTSSYVLINDFLDLDKQEAHKLLQYVYEGNDTFIAASNFGAHLEDTLNLEIKTQYSIQEDSVLVHLANNSFPKKDYPLKREFTTPIFLQ